MIDGGTAASVIGKVAGSAAPTTARKAVRLWRLSGTIEPTWLRLETLSGDEHELTVGEVADIEEFLAAQQLRPLLMLVVASRLLGGDDTELIATLSKQFTGEARRWCTDSGAKWDKSAPAIWERVTAVLGFALPTPARAETIAHEVDQFSAHVRSLLTSTSSMSVAELTVGRLMELATDLNRVSAALDLAGAMAALERERNLPPIMSHSDIDNPPEFAKLYVPRTLVDIASGVAVSSHDITHAEASFRVVLLGNPGAGKSTFVRNLAHELSVVDSVGSRGQACVTVRCREYLKSGSFREPIVDYVAATMHAAGIPDLTVAALSDAMLLGQVVVIFDGLDEITQTPQRAEMVERIETLARTFPLASLLVTSREVGYQRAIVDERIFQHTTLREFSDSQVAEYAKRWFTAQASSHLIEPFIRESETVVDLRSSPLLLSLLCVLYRARGSLPRRRLEVYSKCADLLFHTWDSHRQIEQPEELPKYGDRLMQEIARWVFDSSAAQEGLPESVLEKVISVYLVDVGIGGDEAARRAKDFLEFCAGRAWLLGSFGTTTMGERLFGFTHRTFFEYFTAEALARKSKDADEVCAHITAAFERDETSVLPELLIQAYDEKQNQGGPEVFKAASLGGASAGLILRLMNGSLLSSHIRRLGFAKIIDGWKADKRSVGREAFDALFTLEPNAFEQFVREFVDQPSEADARHLLTHGWASNYLLHREHHSSELVVETIERIADQIVKAGGKPDWDLAVWNWLVASGTLALPQRDTWLFLAVGTSCGSVPGAVPAVLTRWLLGRRDIPAEAVVQVLGGWEQSLQTDSAIPNLLALRMLEAADPVVQSSLDPLAFRDLPMLEAAERVALVAMLAIAMIGSEVGHPPDAPWFKDVIAVRAGKLGKGPEVSAEHGVRVASLCKCFPPWARLWILGQHSLVGDTPPGLPPEVMTRYPGER